MNIGLSNAISELVEAVASSAKENYEVVSSEDMIANIEKVNEENRKNIGGRLSMRIIQKTTKLYTIK